MVLPSALAQHPFLRGMPEPQLGRLAGAAALRCVPAGHRFFETGGLARQFWLIRTGQVALDVEAPGQRGIIVETLGRGEVVGISWLLPPLQWQFGAVAVQPTEVFEFDAAVVRRFCEEDPVLGYDLNQRMLRAVAQRLRATRGKLLDLYVQLAALR